jgi:sulfur carrier protein
MRAIINGHTRDIDPGTTVEAVVAALTSADSGIAVALNDDVVPRTEWSSTTLGEDDRLDVVTAVQGG